MANLFHTEMVRMRTESQRAATPSTQEATGSQTFAKARKRSMLPKGCYFIKTLYYENMILQTQYIDVSEFDDDEEEEDF